MTQRVDWRIQPIYGAAATESKTSTTCSCSCRPKQVHLPPSPLASTLAVASPVHAPPQPPATRSNPKIDGDFQAAALPHSGGLDVQLRHTSQDALLSFPCGSHPRPVRREGDGGSRVDCRTWMAKKVAQEKLWLQRHIQIERSALRCYMFLGSWLTGGTDYCITISVLATFPVKNCYVLTSAHSM